MGITAIDRLKFQQQEWRVETTHAITQKAINDYMAQQGEATTSPGKFFYNGRELDGYAVPFKVVEFLAKNRAEESYDFTAYHKPTKSGPWTAWKEGKKTPVQRIRQMNHLFDKRGANPLKKPKRRAG